MDTPVRKLRLLPLAIPLLIEQVLRHLVGTVNVFMLSNVSDEISGAVGVANQILDVVVIAFTLISAGAAIVVNQTLGAKRYEEGAATSMNAVSASVALGILTSLALGLLAPRFIRMMNLEEALQPEAAAYLRIVGGASVLLAVSSMLSAIFRCYGNTRIPMLVMICNNLFNILGCWIVVFRPFETPLSGASGIAAVRAMSEGVGVILQTILLIRAKKGFRLRDVFRPRFARILRILKLGIMSGMDGISYPLGQVVTTSFLTALGTVALSAKVYVQNVDKYAYVVGLAIGQATQIMSGHLIGAKKYDEAYRLINRNWRYILLCNVFFGTAMFVFAPQIMHLFTRDPEIIALARKLFFIDIFIHTARSMSHCFNYGLRSAGFVFWPMIVASSSMWLFNVGGGYVCSVLLSLGAVGLWIAQTVDEWVRGVYSMICWLRRPWQRMLERQS